MQQATYRGYVLWGHAIEQQEEVLAPERYAASGTITHVRKFIEASGVLGVFDTEEEVQDAGLSWARAWVDFHE
ncbi:hypothetical protein [Burkholderia cepacia]|uniref:Transposase n=1 Tax=Burkholderia cepacia TaxID=292 RepID=A0A8I1AW88_BURCE|nr:hypothetical protein [Burkholderia cepacia]MBA9902820.1 hypothetical protein [Burkholderia cepacia]MBA9947350.1 hypothetical protein [Burkholderia cepacia]MBA9977527.1 hypothetical protein [Burkholderia cepacia]MBA9996282.1 hypothetical protein [Burkholderia cepacia]MBB0004166.1 hypothetical protein [Burkholderia cepacia]